MWPGSPNHCEFFSVDDLGDKVIVWGVSVVNLGDQITGVLTLSVVCVCVCFRCPGYVG